MKKPVISIVMATYNRCDLVEQCLNRIFELAPNEPSFELIVVDNASKDGTAEMLERYPNPFVLIRNRENRNFAGANNQAAEVALGDYLVMLNADTMPEAGYLQALLSDIESNPDTGIVGCKLLYPDSRTIQHAGVAIGESGMPFHIYRNSSEDALQVNYRREFQAVTAACWIVRSDLYQKLGGFDEGYLNGFEDVDFCLRVGEAGFKVAYSPKAVVLHYEESLPGRSNHNGDNWRRFEDRWWNKLIPDSVAIYAEDGLQAIEIAPRKVRLTLAAQPKQKELAEAWRLIHSNRYHKAERLVQSLQEKYPDEPVCWEYAVELAKRQGKYSVAAHTAWEQSQRFADDAAGMRAVELAKRSNELEFANAILVTLQFRLQSPRDHARWYALRGDLALRRGDLDTAKQDYQFASGFATDEQLVKTGLGNLALMQREFRSAKLLYSEVLSIDPESSRALLGMAIALQQEGNLSLAATFFEEAVRCDPSDLNAAITYAALGIQTGQAQRVVELLERCRRRVGDMPELLLTMASSALAIGNSELTTELAELVLQQRPGDSAALQLLERTKAA